MPFILQNDAGRGVPFLMACTQSFRRQVTSRRSSLAFRAKPQRRHHPRCHAMAKKGEAGRALGCSPNECIDRGTPSAQHSLPCVSDRTAPCALIWFTWMFMVIILGLTCISTLSGHGKRNLLVGLMCAALGFVSRWWPGPAGGCSPVHVRTALPVARGTADTAGSRLIRHTRDSRSGGAWNSHSRRDGVGRTG